MVYFTSDLHLGHNNICKYRTIFASPEEHDNYIFTLLESLTKRDIVFILGDFIFHGNHLEEYIKRLTKLSCRIKLVMGNHDTLKLLTVAHIEHLNPLTNYKGLWLSHCPIHPQEMRERKGNVHGHLHSENVMVNGSTQMQDSQYFNVNIEDNDYQLVPLDTIKEYFDKQTSNNENITKV